MKRRRWRFLGFCGIIFYPERQFYVVEPNDFRVIDEINAHMHLNDQPDPIKAMQQSKDLFQLLKQIGATLIKDQARPHVPDIVFSANAGMDFVFNGFPHFIPARFKEPARQGEEAIYESRFANRGYKVRRALLRPNEHHEGEGDMLEHKGILYGGWGDGKAFRSSQVGHQKVAEAAGLPLVLLKLVSPYFYHVDTAIAFLDDATVMAYMPAFDNVSQEEIRRRFTGPGKTLIELTKHDAMKFAANTIVFGRKLVMNTVSDDLVAQLTDLGFEVHRTEMSEFLKAGGATKCSVLNTPAFAVYTWLGLWRLAFPPRIASLVAEKPAEVPRFEWTIPDRLDAALALAASERAARERQAIRTSGKPWIQSLIEWTYARFKNHLQTWLDLLTPASARNEAGRTARRRLGMLIANEILAKWPGLRRQLREFFERFGDTTAEWIARIFEFGNVAVARQFVLPGSPKNFVPIQRTLRRQEAKGLLSSICLAGEKSVTDEIAQYGVDNIVDLLDRLEGATIGDEPLQLAVKISQLVGQFDPQNPVHLQLAEDRLRRITQHALRAGVEIVVDGERYRERNAQIAVFKCIAETLPSGARMGIMVQDYFKDTPGIIDDLLKHADRRGRNGHGYRLSLRLAKGAYAEEERKAGAPILESKEEVDRQFRRITAWLMAAAANGRVYPMIATMNVNEQSYAIECARTAGLGRYEWELQMLYGMQPTPQKRLVVKGFRLRLYLLFADRQDLLKATPHPVTLHANGDPSAQGPLQGGLGEGVLSKGSRPMMREDGAPDAFASKSDLPPEFRILIAEDNPYIREAMVADLNEAFEAAGIENVIISLATNGREALSHYEAARAVHQPFDLIVTDYMMPSMDGLALAHEIRRSDQVTPISICSGDSQLLDKKKLTDLKVRLYPKPEGISDITHNAMELVRAKQLQVTPSQSAPRSSRILVAA